eukprot:scaffold288729_cov19-Tisochrysis_lutea.AAC.1
MAPYLCHIVVLCILTVSLQVSREHRRRPAQGHVQKWRHGWSCGGADPGHATHVAAESGAG